MDWATWLVLDMQDEGSDDDLDYKDTEEEEEAEDLSDNDVSDAEVDQLQIVSELCVELAQAQAFVAYQEQDRKKTTGQDRQSGGATGFAVQSSRLGDIREGGVGDFCQRGH